MLVAKNEKLICVGYIQRHFAEKISNQLIEILGEEATRKSFTVCRLKTRPDAGNGSLLFEAELLGVIKDVRNFLRREEAKKTNGGIFDEPPKFRKQRNKNFFDVQQDEDDLDMYY